MVVIGQPLPRRRRSRWWLTLLLILFIVIVVLLLTNGVLALLRRGDAPAKPDPGALIYATTFEDGTTNWQQEPGQASTQIKDGMLLVAIDEVRSIYSLLDYDFSDVDARVNVTTLAATSEYDQFGLMFRFKDTSNYYMFKLRGDGAYRVELFKEGTLDVISDWQIVAAVRTGIGAVNQLRVVAQGETFTFSVNDKPLSLCLKGSDRRATWNGIRSGQCLSNGGEISTSFTDSSIAWGKIGLGVLADSPGVRVAFDNVLVYGPTGNP
jgi:hypothetical protein